MLGSPFNRQETEKRRREWIHSLEFQHQRIILLSQEDGAWEFLGNRRSTDVKKQKQNVVRVPLR